MSTQISRQNSSTGPLPKLARLPLIAISIGLTLYLFYVLSIVIYFAPVNVDAGHHLSVATRILEGYIPYRDIGLFYTPIAFYFFAAGEKLFGLFGVGNYQGYLLTVLAFEALTCLATFKVVESITGNALPGYLSAVLTWYLMLGYEGCFIILEPFVTFFAVFAVFFLLRPRATDVLFAGICLSVAFLCKQYAALLIAPAGYAVLHHGKTAQRQIQYLLSFGVGLLVPLLLFVAYFSVLHGVEFSAIVDFLSYPNFKLAPIEYFWQILLALLIFGLVVFYAHLMLREVRPKLKVEILLALLFVFSLFPLFFRQFDHYRILAVPYGITLTTCVLWRITKNETKQPGKGLFLCCFIWVLLCGVALQQVRSILQFNGFSYRQAQQHSAHELNRIIPERSVVLMFGDPSYMYLCNFLPVEIFKGGYIFLNYFPDSELAALAAKAPNVVIQKNDSYFSTSLLTADGTRIELVDLLKQSGHHITSVQSPTYEIWQK